MGKRYATSLKRGTNGVDYLEQFLGMKFVIPDCCSSYVFYDINFYMRLTLLLVWH